MEEAVAQLLKNQIKNMMIMKYWPAPDSYSKNIPYMGTPGSFWENRGDRYHCGIDLYGPEGSSVISIEEGRVIDIGIFTSPDKAPYWNITKYVTIKGKNDYFLKYA